MRPEAALLRGMAAFLEAAASFTVEFGQRDSAYAITNIRAGSAYCYQMADKVDEYEGDA